MFEKNVVSLFSGCGGMDLGFEGGFKALPPCVPQSFYQDWVSIEEDGWLFLKKTGFTTVFANDIQQFAKNTWVPFFKKRGTNPDVFRLGSIVDIVKFAQKDNRIFPKIGIDVVTGGFPCQDFSVAGKRLGFQSHKSHLNNHIDVDNPSVESRGMLYFWMREVISLLCPKIFIAENVKGLISLKDAKEVIQKDFESINGKGYILVPPTVLSAVEYGVPQTRERVFFIGFLKSALREEARVNLTKERIPDEWSPFPRPTHSHHKNNGFELFNKQPFVSSGQVLLDLPEPDDPNCSDLSQRKYSKAKWYGRKCQGQTEIKLDLPGPTIRSEHHGNIEFRRLSAEHGGQISSELRNGLPERRLTVRECARLQTFPDEFELVRDCAEYPVNTSDAYRAIGNAVPPILAFHLAIRLRQMWPKYFAS